MRDQRIEYTLLFTEEMDTVIENLVPIVYGQIREQVGANENGDWAVLGAGMALAACKSAIKLMQVTAAESIMARIKPEQVQ